MREMPCGRLWQIRGSIQPFIIQYLYTANQPTNI
jgi:hypothetical protein